MNPRELASYLAKNEKGSHQAKIGDMREVVSTLADLIYKEGTEFPNAKFWRPMGVTSPTVVELYKLGKRRAKKKPKRGKS